MFNLFGYFSGTAGQITYYIIILSVYLFVIFRSKGKFTKKLAIIQIVVFIWFCVYCFFGEQISIYVRNGATPQTLLMMVLFPMGSIAIFTARFSVGDAIVIVFLMTIFFTVPFTILITHLLTKLISNIKNISPKKLARENMFFIPHIATIAILLTPAFFLYKDGEISRAQYVMSHYRSSGIYESANNLRNSISNEKYEDARLEVEKIKSEVKSSNGLFTYKAHKIFLEKLEYIDSVLVDCTNKGRKLSEEEQRKSDEIFSLIDKYFHQKSKDIKEYEDYKKMKLEIEKELMSNILAIYW